MEQNNQNKKDFKKIFSLNNIFAQLINWAAYILLITSIIILFYFSFIDKLDIEIDWTTLGIYSGAAVLLTWINWNSFYKKRYEKIMSEDIEQIGIKKYSIHKRYYNIVRDYDEDQLQKDIDEFNDEYERKWLQWVEKYTGVPIETTMVPDKDSHGNQKVDENGNPIFVEVKGIKERKYRKFKHKIIMWRIKTHHYPQSGYKTSMELRSLLSFRDSDLNKRNLKASRNFYYAHSIRKLITTLLTISIGGSLVPDMINGNFWEAILKLIIALGSLLFAVIMGALNGIRGARLKLSTVEEACSDMENWRHKTPEIEPYDIFKTEPKTQQNLTENNENNNQIGFEIFEHKNTNQ